MRIQHNIMAMNAYRNYNNNTSALSKNLEKLSSGYKINRAGDDAAGLAISEKMRAQITGLKSATKNVKDGVSLVKTAEGALQEVHDMLNRMDSLATQSANGTYDNEVDRANLQKEVNALRSEIDRIADSSNFNGKKLLDGSLDGNATTPISAAADSTAKKSGVDVTIKGQDKVTIGGQEKNLTFELAVGTQGAKIAADGKVTVTLTAAKSYTAAEIQDLIKNANTDTVARLCVQANTHLPDDIVAALVSSLLTMTTGRVPCLTWPGMTGRSAIQISMYLTDGTMGVLVEFAVFFMFFASFQFEIWKQKTTVYR